MNMSLFHGHLSLAVLLCLGLLAMLGCGTSHDPAEKEAGLSWHSPRIDSIKSEYDQLWKEDSRKQRANPEQGKEIYTGTEHACELLFNARLSPHDLRQLTTTCESLPARFRDREGGFYADLLDFMVVSFMKTGDRDALVELLSKRSIGTLGGMVRIEEYLALHVDLLQGFRRGRLKDPIPVLGEAYDRCQQPDVRTDIAAAVRRAFSGSGIEGDDDAKFVARAMQWYNDEKDHLTMNPKYWSQRVLPPYEPEPGAVQAVLFGRADGREPLFVKTAAQKSRAGKVVAVLVIWLVHVGIGAILSAPIVFFGRKRVRWRVWECLVFVLPFAVWAALMASELSTGRKTVQNLGELAYLALAIPVVAILRVSIGSRFPQPRCGAILIGLLCVAAALTFATVPPLMR